jgi:energy-coupling factor transporter transmembrane protein EcfT
MLIIFCCAKILVWIIIISLFLALTALFFFMFFYANSYDKDDNNWKYLRYGSFGVLGAMVIYAIIILCCFQQIRLATALIKATSRFILKTP